MAFLASSGCPPHLSPFSPCNAQEFPWHLAGLSYSCPVDRWVDRGQCSFQICVLIVIILSPSLARLEMRTASRMKSTSPGPSLRSFGHHYFHHWHLIQDDGGFPITGYKIDMLDIQTNNWLEITFIEVFHIHHINNSFCSKNLNVNKSPIIWCKNKIKFWTTQMIQDYLLTRQLLANATLSNCI